MKKNMLLLVASFAFLQSTIGQMDLPPSGGNPRARVTEEVGITEISIKYSRPDVGGREEKYGGTWLHMGSARRVLSQIKTQLPGGRVQMKTRPFHSSMM